MKAMVLAAGLGTRLRPLTNDRPKALVELNGKTLLEITLARLRAFGIRDVILNAHHFADQIESYLRQHDNFGMHVEVSREDVLLDTGGGLKQAAEFFLSTPEEPFLMHNVDVLSTIDFGQLTQFHRERGALATLAVQPRRTSRYLLFDQRGQLCGRRLGNDPETVEWAVPVDRSEGLAFCGIQIISPHLLQFMTEEGVFSIITTYLRLAAQGERIVAYRADASYWRDLGTIEHLQQAEQDLASGRFTF